MWSDYYRGMVKRNIGIITDEEQKKIRESCICVAGCGGIGGLLAEQFVRLGVGRIKIADFDSFEIQNVGRQVCASSSTLGEKKAATLGRHLQEINPELQIEVFDNGVQSENADKFVEKANIVMDGIDYFCFYNSVILHRAANRAKLYTIVSQAIAFGGSLLVFSPDTVNIEEYVGLKPDSTREEIEKYIIPINKFCPCLPRYIRKEFLMDICSGNVPAPSIIMSLHLTAAMAVGEAVMIILDRVKSPTGPGPRTVVFDFQDRRYEVLD